MLFLASAGSGACSALRSMSEMSSMVLMISLPRFISSELRRVESMLNAPVQILQSSELLIRDTRRFGFQYSMLGKRRKSVEATAFLSLGDNRLGIVSITPLGISSISCLASSLESWKVESQVANLADGLGLLPVGRLFSCLGSTW